MKIKIRNASDILITYYIIYLLLGCIFTTTLLQSQTVKQQAEQQLEKMSPAEIDAKIKEYGMTREQAEAKAKEYGVDLQQYLKIQSVSRKPQEKQEIQEYQPEVSIQTQTIIPSAPSILPSITSVPGFENRTGMTLLQPFAYSIFQLPASTFEPVINLPTPPNYLLGPGDEILLTMWGETQLSILLVVNKEGNIIVPNAGPIPAQGITIEALRKRLVNRLTSYYSGLRNGAINANTWLDVSIGKLRTIQIYVLGEVNKPGAYAISSMSTSFLALYLAGGVNINGSLRNIDIIRNNKTISTIDFYDYAIRGDKSKDIRLQDGDIVFVKIIGKRVGLIGSTIRQAIYELKSHETLKDIIEMSGGLPFYAYTDRIHIERIIPFSERHLYEKNIIDIDLSFPSYESLLNSNFQLENGDLITIYNVNNFLENRVTISGNVKKPGVFALKKSMNVKDLIILSDSLLEDTFMERADITRLLPTMRRQIISFNLKLAMEGEPKNNIELKRDDEIIIYKIGQFFPEHFVNIYGAVRKPGKYIRHQNMTVADLVVMAGGLTETASKVEWELSRIDTMKLGSLSKVTKFNVSDNYWDNQNNQPISLEDFDHVTVPQNPKFNFQRAVEITGYVMYPGTYVIKSEDDKLSDIIKRAGGLKPGAYLEGATIVRKWNESGLVPIDFKNAIENENSIDNINLINGDQINIPFKQELVLVRGEVFMQSAIIYEKGASLSYYIKQAGGTTNDADEENIYVMLPNGKKWEKGWFILPDPDILGGSTIYVPKLVEKEDKSLPIMRDWSTMLLSIVTVLIAIVQLSK